MKFSLIKDHFSLDYVHNVFYNTILSKVNWYNVGNEVDGVATDGINIFYNEQSLSALSAAEIREVLMNVSCKIYFKHAYKLNLYKSNALEIDREALNLASNIDATKGYRNIQDTVEKFKNVNIDKSVLITASLEDLYNNFKIIGTGQNDNSGDDDQNSDSNNPSGSSCTLLSRSDVQNLNSLTQDQKNQINKPTGSTINNLIDSVEHRVGDFANDENSIDSLMPKKAGDTSGKLEEAVITPVLSKLDAIKLLRKFLTQQVKSEKGKTRTSYSKLRKRFLPTIYLPSEITENVLEISAILDISGSISSAQLNVFVSELKNIVNKFKFNKVRVMTFNTEVVLDTYIRKEKDIDALKIKANGGTNLNAVFKYLADPKSKHKKNTLGIIFSDLECEEVSRKYAKIFSNTVYFCYDNPKATAKFGYLIKLNSKDK